jgi:hypothetical protein
MSSLINNISSGVTTVLLTSSSSNPIGRALAGLTIYSTALGLEKQITSLSEIIANNTANAFDLPPDCRVALCIKTVTSVSLTALAFYAALQIASTTLAFIAIPIATLSVKNAYIVATISATFAKAFKIDPSKHNKTAADPDVKVHLPSNYELTPNTQSVVLNKAFSIREMDPIFRIPYSATIYENYLNGTTYRTEEYLFFLRNDGKPFRVLNTTPSTENRAEKSS